MPTRFSRLIAAFAVAAGIPAAAMAGPQHEGHDMHAAHKAQMEETSANRVAPADVTISDAAMLDQAGAERRMASDVVGNRILVVDFIFTSCTTICPVTTALMAQAHGRLSDIGDDELAFVSMSIDPNTDTPARLTAFAARAKADWTFLTGEKRVMDKALTDMDAYSTNPEDHAPMIVIGDASTGEFVRIFGLPDPAMIEQRVRAFKSARAAGTTGHAHHH